MTGIMDINTLENVFTKGNIDEVTKIAYKYLKDWEDAQDLTQDLFLKLYGLVAAARFVWWDWKSFMGWCNKTVRNMALNWMRAERARRKTIQESLAFMEQSSEEQSDITLDAAAELADSLSVGQQICYIHRFLEGASYEEIAQTQGLSVSTVRSQCSRAKHAIYNRLLGN